MKKQKIRRPLMVPRMACSMMTRLVIAFEEMYVGMYAAVSVCVKYVVGRVCLMNVVESGWDCCKSGRLLDLDMGEVRTCLPLADGAGR